MKKSKTKAALVIVLLLSVSMLVIPLSSEPSLAVSGCAAGVDNPYTSAGRVYGQGGFQCFNGGTSSVQICLFESANYGLTYDWWTCRSWTYTDTRYHQPYFSVATVSGSAARYWFTRFYLYNSRAGQSGYWYSGEVQNFRKPA